MLLDCFLTSLVIHKISGDEQAFATFFLNRFLRILRVLFFFGEEDNGNICTLTGIED